MRKTLLCTAALIGGFTSASFGQTWDGDTSTDFTDGNNWDSGTAPTDGGWTINDVSTNTPSITSEIISQGADSFIGTGGNTGVLDINSGGSVDSSTKWMFVGGDNGSAGNGTINVNTNGEYTSDNQIRLGRSGGSGTLNVNGGMVNIGALDEGSGTAIVNVNSGGSLTSTNGTIRMTGGVSSIDNGSVSSSGNVIVNSGALLTISNGATLIAGNETWVGNGSGNSSTLTVNAGSVTSNAWIAVGRDGATGELNINGGTIVQNNNFIAIGSDLGAGAGNGTVNQTSGSVTAPAVKLGENGASVGTYNISGGSLDAGAGDLEIGFNGTTNGTLNVSSSATVTSTGTTFVGKLDTSTGALNVEGSAATISLGTLVVGLDGTLADSGAVGTVGFVADSSGISTVAVAGDVNLSSPDGDFLTVDLSAMTGSGTIDLLLIDGATSQGEFTGLTQGATVSGALGGTIDYSEAGNVWLRGVSVPEPSVAFLGGLGALALLRRRRISR